MLITTLSATPDGSQQALQRQHLTARTGDEQSPVFRRVLYLRLPTGGSAEEIQIEGDARLRAAFSRFDYNALTVSETALRASLSTKSEGVLVTLDAPRRISEITLSLAKSAAGQTLEIYRLDGDTPASEPSVSAIRLMLIGVIEQNFPGSSIATPVEGITFGSALLSANDSAPLLLAIDGAPDA
ncbi:MAG TPA: hypothetical protein VMN39_12340, partial [Longimicrobiaceae bacterium]|nr:hypothetical protein [Longimicrobiaceae bacterium]